MAPTRIEIGRILCPVDFSEFSAPALERAVRLGNWFEARVEVLHVIPFAVPAGVGLPYFPAPLEVTRAQREQAAQGVADLVAPFLGEGVPIETKVLEGEPWRVIREEAEALPADLLVMGTHGRSGFEHLLLGSVTEKVLRRTPCPVLTVGKVPPHPRKGPLFRRILCAADLTQASERTLDVALSLASENDARITLLHVVESLPGESGARLYLAVPEIGPLRRDLVDQARVRLRKAVPDAARDFCNVSERVETGAAWSEILRVAEEVDADLIVMGAHTGGGVSRALFGSTSSHVVRRAGCPVMVIHETDKKRPSAEPAEAVGAAADPSKGEGR
jgi:nucleotide-binding universal stress UspA family protein